MKRAESFFLLQRSNFSRQRRKVTQMEKMRVSERGRERERERRKLKERERERK